MANTEKKIEFDTYSIQGTTWKKEVYLGPKTWRTIDSKAPGKFVDILEAKFSEQALLKKIDINKGSSPYRVGKKTNRTADNC